MSAPKVVSLSVRPFQVTHLCFEVGGILESSVAQLGAPVQAFDFPTFYATLSAVPTVTGDPSRLLYNSGNLASAVSTYALVSLRNEPRKASLNNAINARQNAYFAKYGNAAAIIAQIDTFYSPSTTDSKPQRLQTLASIASDQWTALKDAYNNAGRTGVVTNTVSTLCSDTTSYGYSATSGINDTFSLMAPDLPAERPTFAPPKPPAPWASPQGWPAGCPTPGAEGTANHKVSAAVAAPPPKPPPAAEDHWGQWTSGPSDETATIQKGTSYQTGSSGDKAFQTQTIINTDYGFRAPYFEGRAQYERAQISLMDQQFAQFMYAQKLPHLAQVFENELSSIDSNVYRMQVAYLDTILMSPIPGIVTGIYKNAGDAVKAGEPVLRIEDNTYFYLIATVVYRGPIAVCPPSAVPPPPNSTLTVQTSLYGAPGPLTTLTGTVVSARGQRDDDKWDLVVKCKNPLDALSNPVFPLGYRFDDDDTTLAIS